MKTYNFCRTLKTTFLGLFVVGLISLSNTRTHGQSTNVTHTIRPEDMISSVHVKWFQVSEADKTVRAFKSQREQIIATLLSVFQNRTTENFNRCGCAYYLGEMRASEAAAVLASDITLELDYSHILVQGIPLVAYDPAFTSLFLFTS